MMSEGGFGLYTRAPMVGLMLFRTSISRSISGIEIDVLNNINPTGRDGYITQIRPRIQTP